MSRLPHKDQRSKQIFLKDKVTTQRRHLKICNMYILKCKHPLWQSKLCQSHEVKEMQHLQQCMKFAAQGTNLLIFYHCSALWVFAFKFVICETILDHLLYSKVEFFSEYVLNGRFHTLRRRFKFPNLHLGA